MSYEAIAAIEKFSTVRVLCLGDIMLDKFIYGSVDRISPEAPVPVFSIQDERIMLGGVGNVMRNLLALGSHVSLISVIGNDKVGREVAAMIGKETNVIPFLITENGRITTAKMRYVAGNHQVLRADNETTSAITNDTQMQIEEAVISELQHNDIIILSDYGKGVLTRTLVHKVITLAKEHQKTVIVDPKSKDFSHYYGATLISPNLAELANASSEDISSDDKIIYAARKLMETHHIANILVTRSKDGMTLVMENGENHPIRARVHEVYDVSGAGDTAIATLTLAIASGLSLPESASMANIAAGVVVGKPGTAIINTHDLKMELFVNEKTSGTNKIQILEDAVIQVKRWKSEGKVVSFTNGCFDLMHSGHISVLNRTKMHCDKLIVAVNSDASVRKIKGENRPINNEMERALLLASLSVVDMVILFSEDNPLKLLEVLKPDVLAKGADYQKHEVVGHELVESYGGKIVLIPLKEGYNTADIVTQHGLKPRNIVNLS